MEIRTSVKIVKHFFAYHVNDDAGLMICCYNGNFHRIPFNRINRSKFNSLNDYDQDESRRCPPLDNIVMQLRNQHPSCLSHYEVSHAAHFN